MNVDETSLAELLEVTRDCQSVFANGSDDLDRLKDVSEVLNQADQARAAELEKQRDILRALSRQYETQKAAAQRPLPAPTEKQHREALAKLDDEKLQLGKKVSVLESEAASREGKLATARAARVEAERTEGEESAVDPDVFKLALMRGLGFVPVRDAAGKFSELLIRNPQRPDVRLIAAPEGKKTDANQLWSLLAGPERCMRKALGCYVVTSPSTPDRIDRLAQLDHWALLSSYGFVTALGKLRTEARKLWRTPGEVQIVTGQALQAVPSSHGELDLELLAGQRLSELGLPQQPAENLRDDILRAIWHQTQLGDRRMETAFSLLVMEPTFDLVVECQTVSRMASNNYEHLCAIMRLVICIRSASNDGFVEDGGLRSLATELDAFLVAQQLARDMAMEQQQVVAGERAWTVDQLKVRDIASVPGITLVHAAAGSGKTSSAMALAERCAEQKIYVLVVSFTTAVRAQADDAIKGFHPSGVFVQSRTLGSLAFEYLKTINPRMVDRSENLYAKQVKSIIRVPDVRGFRRKPEDGKDESKIIKADSFAMRILTTLNVFCNSVDRTPSAEHAQWQKYRGKWTVKEDLLVMHTRMLWEKLSNVKAGPDMPLPHPVRTKLLQLSPEGTLRMRCGRKPDVLIFDEAQDGSDADISYVRHWHINTRVVLIGDPHQKLYQFRGAHNAWVHNEHLAGQPDQVIALKDSFRYGPEVASVANIVLDTKDAEYRIIGRAPSGTIHRPQQQNAPLRAAAVLIHRTNGGILKSLFRIGLAEPGRRIFLKMRRTNESGSTPDKHWLLHLYRDASALKRGDHRPSESRHTYLKRFQRWEDLVEEVETLQEDTNPKSLIDIVEMEEVLDLPDFTANLDEIERCITSNEGDANLILTNTHQFKGLEADIIALADDFVDLFDTRYEHRKWTFGQAADEVNGLYVAATRAKKALLVNGTIFRMLLTRYGLHNFSIMYSKNGQACKQCGQAQNRLLGYEAAFPTYDMSGEEEGSEQSDVESASFEGSELAGPHATQVVPSTPKRKGLSGIFKGSEWGTPSAASRIHAVATSDLMPCCLDCAQQESAYAPLRRYAAFFEAIYPEDGNFGTIDWHVYLSKSMEKRTGPEAKAPSMRGYVSRWPSLVHEINQAIRTELEVKRFFAPPVVRDSGYETATPSRRRAREESPTPRNVRQRSEV